MVGTSGAKSDGTCIMFLPIAVVISIIVFLIAPPKSVVAPMEAMATMARMIKYSVMAIPRRFDFLVIHGL